MSKSVTDLLHYLVKLGKKKEDILSLSKGIFVEEITYKHTAQKKLNEKRKLTF